MHPQGLGNLWRRALDTRSPAPNTHHHHMPQVVCLAVGPQQAPDGLIDVDTLRNLSPEARKVFLEVRQPPASVALQQLLLGSCRTLPSVQAVCVQLVPLLWHCGGSAALRRPASQQVAR
jgi:hypothetical protein